MVAAGTSGGVLASLFMLPDPLWPLFLGLVFNSENHPISFQ